jgi:oligopeptide/dipeptide ABC transporter ATP-binding protein
VPKLTDTGDAPLRTIEGLPPVLIDPPDACAFADRCPHAMRICRQKDPDYFTPVAGSRAACWLHHEQAEASRKTFLETRFGHDRAA